MTINIFSQPCYQEHYEHMPNMQSCSPFHAEPTTPDMATCQSLTYNQYNNVSSHYHQFEKQNQYAISNNIHDEYPNYHYVSYEGKHYNKGALFSPRTSLYFMGPLFKYLMI